MYATFIKILQICFAKMLEFHLKIFIEYCGQWNYKPQALRVRDKLLELYTANVQLVEGGAGIFEITHKAKVLFSKKIVGRFPTDEDLQKLGLGIDFDN